MTKYSIIILEKVVIIITKEETYRNRNNFSWKRKWGLV